MVKSFCCFAALLTVLSACFPFRAAAISTNETEYTLSGSYSGVLKSMAGGNDYMFRSVVNGVAQYRQSADAAGGAYDSLYIAAEFLGVVLNTHQETVGTVTGRFSERYDRIHTVRLAAADGAALNYLYSYGEAPFAGGYMSFHFSAPEEDVEYDSGSFANYQAESAAVADAVACGARGALCSYLLSSGHAFADVAGSLDYAGGIEFIGFELWNYSTGGQGTKEYQIREGHLSAAGTGVPEPGTLLLLAAALLPAGLKYLA